MERSLIENLRIVFDEMRRLVEWVADRIRAFVQEFGDSLGTMIDRLRSNSDVVTMVGKRRVRFFTRFGRTRVLTA